VRFYEITLHSAPAIRFAYRVSLDHYENTFFRKQHLLEFAITEENSTVFHHADGSMDTAAPQTLMGITNCLNCTTSSITDARNVHTTVGIRAEYTACCRDSTQITDLPAYIKTVRDANIILIPFLLPLGSQYPLLLSRLQEIILLHHSDKPADRINAISRWYALCAMLTDLVLQKLGNAHPQLSPAGENYVDRAEAYIKSRLSEKITVAALAAHLSISEGYLHSLFKAAKGMGICAYINHYRVTMAQEYIRNQGLSLNAAAAQVGIDDPAYMSRLFKKITGVSYRQFLAESGIEVGNAAKSR